MSLDLETKKAHAATRKVGVKTSNTILERLLVVLSRYREASIAVVAVLLLIYLEFGSDRQFLSAQFLGVVIRDTVLLGLIAGAELMLLKPGEIVLCVNCAV